MRPFQDGDSFTSFRAKMKSVCEEILALDNDYVLKASATELEKYYLERVKLEPISLKSDDLYIKDQTGSRIDVSNDPRYMPFPGQKIYEQATNLEIAIPFEGDSSLWRIKPSVYPMSDYPDISIQDSEITFRITFKDGSADAKQIRTRIDRSIKYLQEALQNLENDIVNHNNSAPFTVLQVLYKKQNQARATTGAIAGLGIPIKRVNENPIFTVPTRRRSRPTQRPKAEAGKFEPEPILEENEYQHILEILRSMSLVIERNPTSFATLDEETIRDHFLLQLNGHYEGSATGETFNAAGKTDILIREGNKNVFIAECKFWHGQKGFGDAISQLLGYLTWRDSKCAVLVFNKTKDSSAIREKMHTVMEALDEHKKTIKHQSHGDSRYILVKESEPGKEIIVTTQLYDIPAKD